MTRNKCLFSMFIPILGRDKIQFEWHICSIVFEPLGESIQSAWFVVLKAFKNSVPSYDDSWSMVLRSHMQVKNGTRSNAWSFHNPAGSIKYGIPCSPRKKNNNKHVKRIWNAWSQYDPIWNKMMVYTLDCLRLHGTSARWSPYSQSAPLSWSCDFTAVGPTKSLTALVPGTGPGCHAVHLRLEGGSIYED